MSAIFRKPADTLCYTNTTSTDIPTGSFVTVGNLVGIVRNTIPPGEAGTVFFTGDYSDVEKYGADSGAALTAGNVVYLNPSNGKIYNAQASGYLLVGVAAEDAGTTATKCRILLNVVPNFATAEINALVATGAKTVVTTAIATHAAIEAGSSAGNVHPGPSGT